MLWEAQCLPYSSTPLTWHWEAPTAPTGVVLGTCPHEHSDIAILGSDPFGAQTRTNTLGCHTWGGIERAVGGMGW